MRRAFVRAVLAAGSVLSVAGHEGKLTAAGRPNGTGHEVEGVIVGILLFLLIESSVIYLTFKPWFRNPNLPAAPSPELFFHAAVYSFLAMVFTGAVLTYFFSGIDMAHTPLVTFYGYNNVCVVFDNPPSTYICPVYWFFVAYLIVRYAVEDTKRLMRLATIGQGARAVGYGVNVLLVIVAAFFSVTLAIRPELDMYGHTLPFVALVLTLPLVSLMHCWQSKERPNLYLTGVAVYLALSLVKAAFDIYALSSGHHVSPVAAQAVDLLWLASALSAPFVIPAPVLSETLNAAPKHAAA